MEKSSSHIDQQLKGMFETFQPELPFQFERIAAGLDAKKSRRSVILWSSVAAVVFTAVSGIVFLKPDTAQVNPTIASKDLELSKTQITGTERASSNTSNTTSITKSTPEITANKPSTSQGSNFAPTYSSNSIANRRNNSSSIAPDVAHQSPLFFGGNKPTALESQELVNSPFSMEFSGKTLQPMPTLFGYFLQLPVRIPSPQSPKQPLSSWAFEVGYDQNQTAMAYQISPGRETYVHKNYLDRMRNGEIALAAPQLQASLQYQINSNWSVSLGIGFAQNRTLQSFDFRDSIPVSVAQGFEADALGNYPIFGYLGLGQRVQHEGIQTMQMISVPIGLGYQYPINRFWSFNSEVSTRYNRLFASQGKTLNYHDLSLLEAGNDVYRAHIWSARISAGASYQLSRIQYIGFRLNTQGALSPFYKKDASVMNRGWSLGMSVFYTLKLF